MTKQHLDVFYFIKNTQKSTTLRRTDSNGKTYFYAKVTNPTCNLFTRISKYEYDQIDRYWNAKKDCMTTYFKGDKLYQEHCVTFKR